MSSATTLSHQFIVDILMIFSSSFKDEAELLTLTETWEKSSVLKFTYELGVDNKIPFLDVDVENNGGAFVTSIYKKPTESGHCLNAQSECPERYKTS